MRIFPTGYFPSIHYLIDFFQEKIHEIEIHENFPKQTIRNRCEILTGNGVLTLSVPIIHKHGHKQTTKEVEIDYTKNWPLDHWRAIESAYTSAPFFEDYASEIKSLIFYKHKYLIEKNEEIMEFIGGILDLEIAIKKTNVFSNSLPDKKNIYLEKYNLPEIKPYQQVFSYSKPFTPNLSIIDLIFNEGPFCRNWILPSED
jgi:hypothetical protein